MSMRNGLFYFAVLVVAAGAVWTQSKPDPAKVGSPPANVYTARTWGNPSTLRDHFARHGRDFGAKDPEDYARMAYDFFQRAQVQGLPAKVDGAGVFRVFEPSSGTFGAYNPDGTTKTFFKPGSRGYFERQPGRRADLRTRR